MENTTQRLTSTPGGASVGEGRSPQPLLSLEMTFTLDQTTGAKQDALFSAVCAKHKTSLDDIQICSVAIVGKKGRIYYKLKPM
jgi:hypothetical protein